MGKLIEKTLSKIENHYQHLAEKEVVEKYPEWCDDDFLREGLEQTILFDKLFDDLEKII